MYKSCGKYLCGVKIYRGKHCGKSIKFNVENQGLNSMVSHAEPISKKRGGGAEEKV